MRRAGKNREIPVSTLFYVNQIYADELTGQATFERGLIQSLSRLVSDAHDKNLVVFTVRRPGQAPGNGSHTHEILLNKKNYLGYLYHQAILLVLMLREILRRKGDNIVIYVRYNPCMVSPVLIASVFGYRLVFRTGPVFRSMRDFRQDLKQWVHRLVRPIFWAYCKKASKIIVVTQTIKRWLLGRYPFTLNKIEVLPNAADTDKFRPMSANTTDYPISPDDFVIGYAGSLVKEQGVDVVIRALAKLGSESLNNVKLLVIGDGPKKSEWERLTEESGLSNVVIWMGRKPHDEIPSIISVCDLMVLPVTLASIKARGISGTKLFEYIACDKFVLSSRCEDLIFLEETGVGKLVDPDNVEKWAEALRCFISKGKSGVAMKGRARKVSVERFSYGMLASKIWNLCFNEGENRA